MRRALVVVIVCLAGSVIMACSEDPVEQKPAPQHTVDADSISVNAGNYNRNKRTTPPPCRSSEFLKRLI